MTVYSPLAAGTGVLGTGSYVPAREVGNEPVAAEAGVTPEWIVARTGIHARRYAAPDEAASDLAVHACRRALRDAGLVAADIGWIVVASSTPDQPQPATAALVQHRLGAVGSAAFDVNAVCVGFVAALHAAARLVLPGDGPGSRALVVGAEVYSRIIDRTDRRTAPLFGDGAGAVVIGPVDGDRGLLGAGLRTDGHLHELIGVSAGGSRLPACADTVHKGEHHFRMQGRAVRDYVLTELPGMVSGLLDTAGLARSDVHHLVPHQANGVMLADLPERLGLGHTRMHLSVDRYGNTGCASVPVTLDAARRAGDLRPGQVVLLAAFGGGMTIGAAALRWGR